MIAVYMYIVHVSVYVSIVYLYMCIIFIHNEVLLHYNTGVHMTLLHYWSCSYI